jgi:hypothetical protein
MRFCNIQISTLKEGQIMYSFLCIVRNVYSLIMTYCKVETYCTIKRTLSCVHYYYTITTLDKVNYILSKKHYCSCKPSRSGHEELRKNERHFTQPTSKTMY